MKYPLCQETGIYCSLLPTILKSVFRKTKRTGTEIEDYNTKEVLDKYHVTPIEFIDVKALMGDTSDNIPGVPGIGEKTATALIAQYGSIENCYAHVDEIKPPRASQKFKSKIMNLHR